MHDFQCQRCGSSVSTSTPRGHFNRCGSDFWCTGCWTAHGVDELLDHICVWEQERLPEHDYDISLAGTLQSTSVIASPQDAMLPTKLTDKRYIKHGRESPEWDIWPSLDYAYGSTPLSNPSTLNVFRPTYIRVRTVHLLPETLEAYRLPWEYDPSDNNYLLIKEYVSHELQGQLFEHTKQLKRKDSAQISDCETAVGTSHDRNVSGGTHEMATKDLDIRRNLENPLLHDDAELSPEHIKTTTSSAPQSFYKNDLSSRSYLADLMSSTDLVHPNNIPESVGVLVKRLQEDENHRIELRPMKAEDEDKLSATSITGGLPSHEEETDEEHECGTLSNGEMSEGDRRESKNTNRTHPQTLHDRALRESLSRLLERERKAESLKLLRSKSETDLDPFYPRSNSWSESRRQYESHEISGTPESEPVPDLCIICQDSMKAETPRQETMTVKLAERFADDLAAVPVLAKNTWTLGTEIVELLAEFALRLEQEPGTTETKMGSALLFNKRKYDIPLLRLPYFAKYSSPRATLQLHKILSTCLIG